MLKLMSWSSTANARLCRCSYFEELIEPVPGASLTRQFIKEQKLSSHRSNSDQYNDSPFVGKFIQDGQRNREENSCESRLCCFGDGQFNRLQLEITLSTLNTRLEDLETDDSDDTDDGTTEPIKEAREKLAMCQLQKVENEEWQAWDNTYLVVDQLLKH